MFVATLTQPITAIATSSMDGTSFAAMLDRAIERSKTPPKVIEHHPEETGEGTAWTGPLRDGGAWATESDRGEATSNKYPRHEQS